ncbi:MAG: carboxypeptidase regulatory-like domain-containing protein, partial [Planctomycetes bacterium]|nr:carboxypeptidase regulatory-like domain-containing protein [Planctomycetota bacterium]
MRVRGRVVGEDEKPIAGARVAIVGTGTSNRVVGLGESDAAGLFEVTMSRTGYRPPEIVWLFRDPAERSWAMLYARAPDGRLAWGVPAPLPDRPFELTLRQPPPCRMQVVHAD